MTPKEKAEKLFNKFIIIDDLSDSTGNSLYFNAHAKQCAIVAVDEILLIAPEMHMEGFGNLTIREYYKKVKKEIEKL